MEIFTTAWILKPKLLNASPVVHSHVSTEATEVADGSVSPSICANKALRAKRKRLRKEMDTQRLIDLLVADLVSSGIPPSSE